MTHRMTAPGEIMDAMRAYLTADPQRISLPASAYTSPDWYETERTEIFGRSWVLVAHVDQLKLPGDYVALSVAGEPLVVARDRKGGLNALSPICRHRLAPVVEPGAGRTDGFTCPYHLWRYGLDGQLTGAPFMRENEAFDPAACRLPAFAVELWQGFVYVNLDRDATPLAAHLRTVEKDMAAYRLGELVQVGEWTEEWNVNWKLAVENAHENYHVMGLHPNTVAMITPRGADMHVRVDSPWVVRLLSPYLEAVEPEVLELTPEQREFMLNCFVFPSGSIATFFETVVWISFIPLSIDRTQVRGGLLMPPALLTDVDLETLRKENEESAAVVNDEDRRGLEAVQRVVGSRFSARGHLSPKEPGVLAFYQNLARAVLPEGA